MDDHTAMICELTARWPGMSAANKHTWDSMGDLVIRCLLQDLPVIQTRVGQSWMRIYQTHQICRCSVWSGMAVTGAGHAEKLRHHSC